MDQTALNLCPGIRRFYWMGCMLDSIERLSFILVLQMNGLQFHIFVIYSIVKYNHCPNFKGLSYKQCDFSSGDDNFTL